MIAYLSGSVKFVFESYCILDVNGVGYKVFADTHALTVGDTVEFFIHTAVRDDAINLYGFKNRDEFELFELLINISGFGAKSALAVVSKISPADFADAVARQDLKALTNIPGVGKKSAERILLELKGKVRPLAENFSAGEIQPAQLQSTAQDEAAEALSALGYTASEISAAFNQAPKDSSTEQLIKFALKELNRLP